MFRTNHASSANVVSHILWNRCKRRSCSSRIPLNPADTDLLLPESYSMMMRDTSYQMSLQLSRDVMHLQFGHAHAEQLREKDVFQNAEYEFDTQCLMYMYCNIVLYCKAAEAEKCRRLFQHLFRPGIETDYILLCTYIYLVIIYCYHRLSVIL